jgi:hypothetical protein
MTVAAKQTEPRIKKISELASPVRATVPAALARVVAICADMNAFTLPTPWLYIDETVSQIPQSSASLDTAQLRSLSEAGLNANSWKLAQAASTAGLRRGGPTEARFLLLRARALPEHQFQRRCFCAAAVAQIAGQQSDKQLLDDAVSFLRDDLQSDGLSLNSEEAAEVLRKEKDISDRAMNAGPDYTDLLDRKLCDCARCRAARGEIDDPFDDDFDPDEEIDFDETMDEIMEQFPPPPGMPSELARSLLEKATRAVAGGESVDSVMSRLFGSVLQRPSGKKGKR